MMRRLDHKQPLKSAHQLKRNLLDILPSLKSDLNWTSADFQLKTLTIKQVVQSYSHSRLSCITRDNNCDPDDAHDDPRDDKHYHDDCEDHDPDDKCTDSNCPARQFCLLDSIASHY